MEATNSCRVSKDTIKVLVSTNPFRSGNEANQDADAEELALEPTVRSVVENIVVRISSAMENFS